MVCGRMTEKLTPLLSDNCLDWICEVKIVDNKRGQVEEDKTIFDEQMTFNILFP